jgi:hypothetical protein
MFVRVGLLVADQINQLLLWKLLGAPATVVVIFIRVIASSLLLLLFVFGTCCSPLTVTRNSMSHLECCTLACCNSVHWSWCQEDSVTSNLLWAWKVMGSGWVEWG